MNDTELLDYLDTLIGNGNGEVKIYMSHTGRGVRLAETVCTNGTGFSNVRDAIKDAINRGLTKDTVNDYHKKIGF